MLNIAKKSVIWVLFIALSFPTNLLIASAQAADGAGHPPSAGAMLVDGVVIRPLGIVATLLGGATFIVTLPFSALGGNVDEAAHMLVVNPAKMTFKRPLGEFE
jgi:hypothetical protein